MVIVKSKNGWRKASLLDRFTMWLVDDGHEWRAVAFMAVAFFVLIAGAGFIGASL